MRTFLVALLFIALPVILYANTLGGDFIWDDEYLIEKNRYLESWHFLPEIFQSSLHHFAPVQSNYYRPLQGMTYLFDRMLWGKRVWGHHLTNIVLHGMVGFLSYRLLIALGMGFPISFWTALFFLIHPLHTEAVGYISGRADSLYALFILLSILSFYRFLKGKSFAFYLLSLGSFILALLSKEIAVVLPFLLIFLLLWHGKKNKIVGELLFPFFCVLLLYGILRVTLLDFKGVTFFHKEEISFLGGIRISLQSLFLYLKLILFPFPLHMERRLPDQELFWRGEIVVGILIGLLFLVATLISKEKRKCLLGWGWFFIFLLPNTALFLRTDRVAEHFLYLALLGIGIVIVPFGVEQWKFWKGNRFGKSVGWIATASLVFYFSFLTYHQSQVFRDPERFYRNILTHVPTSWTALNNLGTLLEKKNRWDEAEILLEKAIQQKPHRPESHSNFGTLLLRQGDLEGAIVAYRKALRLWPVSPEIHNNLASAYRLRGAWQEAVFEYQQALRLNPDLVVSRYFLVKTYEAMGKKRLAEEQIRYLQERGIRVEIRK